MIARVLGTSGISEEQIDAIAVTVGPGMSLCLRVGLEAARAKAIELGVPLIGVNHLVGHTLMPRWSAQKSGLSCRFPYLSLLVSGGHCCTVLAKSVDEFNVIGVGILWMAPFLY